MKYGELEDVVNFHRNMRRTPWLKLFPHWYDEKDALLNAIGDEVERIKAQAIFALLNAGIKPPVLLWQESLNNKKYNVQKNITQLPADIKIDAPLYKTWGKITLNNNTEKDIDGLELMLDSTNGLIINQLIKQEDKIVIDLYNNTVHLNGKKIKAQKKGQGMPHFITSANYRYHHENTPLHNEVIRLHINTDTNLENTTVTNTVNITEKVESWEVKGEAYQENPDDADPWIVMDGKGRIGYELDFSNVTEISFWYKAEDEAELACYCNNDGIFQKEVNDEWTYYQIDTSNMEGTGKIEFENFLYNTKVYINDIKYKEETLYNFECDIDVDIELDNAVFINEQNIEVTSLELIPIEKIELYAYYDFPFNKGQNGWKKVYQKVYEENTNVIYDMITTHFPTKEFYVDVWFKTLQYPYKVGFPCYRDADLNSMYHVNNRLDTHGEELGLERRMYKDYVAEEDYPTTFPIFYPFDIEQDYWYYLRLINEYTWNDLAVNDVDIVDTDGDKLFRLYSINPFCEDFVVHAKSSYPKDRNRRDCNWYTPKLISQRQNSDNFNAQVGFDNVINLLTKDDDSAYLFLNNKNGQYISTKRYQSKELWTYFDLSDLPENVNIDNIEVEIEAESTDNKTNKYTTNDTGILIPHFHSNETSFIPLTTESSYQLKKQVINYSNNDIQSYISTSEDESTHERIIQKAIIEEFSGKLRDFVDIPFTLYQGYMGKDGIEYKIVDDIETVYLYYNNNLKEGTIVEKNNKTYIHAYVPNEVLMDKITIICKSKTHKPFTCAIDITKKNKFKTVEEGIDVDAPTVSTDVQDFITNHENQLKTLYNEILEQYGNFDPKTNEAWRNGVKALTNEIEINNENLTSIYKRIKFIIEYKKTTEEVEYQYIEGPIVEEEVSAFEYKDEWRTDDFRNLLQKEGLYFRTVFQNDDEQSSTSIYLYNITLKICYSDKKDTFDLKTYIDVSKVKKPVVGKYKLYVENTGEKSLNKTIDIITPPNLHMEKNSVQVSLAPKGYTTQFLDITAEYPLVDGFYDIVTICEDKVKKDSIQVFSDGLIETGVTIKPHHGKYYDLIKLSADVHAIDNSKIDRGANKVAFYINGYMVGNPVQVLNGHAEIEITPGHYKFIDTGVLELEAHYLGNVKYKSSRGYSTIFISKSNTRITLTASDKAIYHGAYQVEAKVEHFNGEKYLPVDDGEVIFYIGNEVLSANSIFSNGIFTSKIKSLENPVGKHILRATYTGSDVYSSNEATQEVEVIGGKANVFVEDVKAKPTDIVKFKATVTDINNRVIPYGFLDFYIDNPDETLIQKNVKIKNGVAITDDWQDTTTLSTDDEKKIYTITAVYHGADDIVIYEGKGTGSLIIEKSEVVIEYQPTYYASQYEPLGFFMRIKDANTNEYISDGTVTITLPRQNNLKISNKVDKDGGLRIVHNPLSFTAREWQDLNKFSFTTAGEITPEQRAIIDDTSILENVGVYDKDELYMIYDGVFSESGIDFILNNDILSYSGEKEDKDHIFMSDSGHLYARATLDSLRKYTSGLQDIIIDYKSDNKYKAQNFIVENGLNIQIPSSDLDIHAYNISYSDNENIICYVTEYDKSDKQTTTTNINTGSVQFVIDDATVGIVDVVDGIAILNKDALYNIKAGNHLLSVRYRPYKTKNTITTYSYEKLLLEKTTPTINLNSFRVTKNRKSNICAILGGNNNADIPLSGSVNLYVDDVLVDNKYLYGNEKIPGLVDYDGNISDLDLLSTNSICFTYIMPDDIDINSHTIKVEYEGNDYFKPASITKIIKQEPAPVTLSVRNLKSSGFYVALGEECSIDVDVSVDDDIINEGKVVLLYGDEEISSGAVVDNVATLTWIQNDATKHQYTLSYVDGQNYINGVDTILDIHVIEPYDSITIPNDTCDTLEEALRCIKNNGTIYIKGDVFVDKQLKIKKDCNIIGTNFSYIVKDAVDLVINANSIYTNNSSLFDTEDNILYEIQGVNIYNLNKNNFVIQDDKLFFKSNNELKRVYLFEDNKFYATEPITLDNINTDINIDIDKDVTVHIDNIIFDSNDNSKKNDFIIQNNGTLIINRSILNSCVVLRNNGFLTAQRNFMYCLCTGGGDLNNNWWGSNTPPYNVDSNIVIEVENDKTPAVISENVKITGKMVGSNGRKYDLPPSIFLFSTDTEGYLSINKGLTTNQEADTILLDATREGNVYFTVDNETVSCPIYEYERKTEVIIDEIHAIPIRYQIPISAKVQSCADVFYEFNDTAEGVSVEKSTQLINEGDMYFYINDKQLGHGPVKNGEASIDVFFTDEYYTANQEYTIKAVYKPKNYYFSSEATFNTKLIDDNNGVCYVSSSGNDNNNGTYASPVKTIQKAINKNKPIIYLLDEYINESAITINNNVTIQAYKNQTTFKDLSGTAALCTIPEYKMLKLKNINLINNSFNYLFNNNGTLDVEKCIFHNNNSTLFSQKAALSVKYSVIVDNRGIADSIYSSNFTYCWFGTDNVDSINSNIDNYVVMDIASSKDILYIGTLAHITGELSYYMSNGTKYKLEDKLPLRVAKFNTDIGSMKPLYDYTYNNKSTSLLNTYEDDNTTQYIVSLMENKNYQDKNVIIKAHISNVFNDIENDTNSNIVFEVTGNNTNTEKTTETITNNIASVDFGKMELGTYNIKCSLYKNGRVYVANGEFQVLKPEVVVEQFNIGNRDNLYYTDINISLKDNFNNKINDEVVNIKIDNNLVGSYVIKNGLLERRLKYNMLKAGQHTMTIYNTANDTKYEKYSYTKTFNVTKKNTDILFPYKNIETNVLNNLLITIVDDDSNYVQEGYVTVNFDDKTILSEVEVSNGVVQINDFKVKDIGQHSISIYYSGDNYHYNESFEAHNIGVGIFNVIFGLKENEYVKADLGKSFNFKTTVTDIGGQNVNHGHVNIYIDDIRINDDFIPVNDGKINFSSTLPTNISPGDHTFTLEYIDPSDLYVDTIFNTFLNIGRIETNIYMNTIYGAPGQKTVMDYQVISNYGTVTTGTLTAIYDGIEIGSATVTDGNFNQITITAPFLPAEKEYQINLTYKDTGATYKDSTATVTLIMQKKEVIIKPSHTQYYPNQLFHFAGYFTDVDKNIINVGKASLYIDNVEETEPQDVINGRIMVPIELTKAKTYKMKLVYEENDYFNYTPYEFNFNIDSVSIKNIHLENVETPSYTIINDVINTLPDTQIKTNIIFETLNNYKVKDGIISFYLDNQNINNYYVAESNKNIILNIGKVKKGPHALRVEYHDSDLFKDLDPHKEFKLNITPQQLSITVNNDEPMEINNHNDIININTHLSKNTDGVIKYYIGLPIYEGDEHNNITISRYDYKFIGVKEITQQDMTYDYQLPKELLSYAIENIETRYKLKATFTGNAQYDEASSEVDLTILKQDCNITFVESKIYTTYRETIDIKFNIDVENNPLVNLYIDSKLIGSVVAEDQYGVLKYKMNSQMIARPESYILTAVFDGSAVNNPTQSSIEIQVTPMVPKISTKNKKCYIGGELELDNVLTDLDNVVIEDNGTLSYNVMGKSATFNLNETGYISLPYEPITSNEQEILASYVPGDGTKYSGFTNKEIPLTLLKNDVQLDIKVPNKISRGETFDVTINAVSSTTKAPVNVPIRLPYKNTNENIVNGKLESSITMPLNTNNNKSFNLEFNVIGNTIFNEQSKTITINNYNQPEITINTSSPQSMTNAHTLEQAIDLVDNYGKVKLITPIDEQIITLEKSVHIDGQNNTVKDWQIINNVNEVAISSLSIQSETNPGYIIDNHGSIVIEGCEFKDAKMSAIYSQHKTTITNCTFSNNSNTSGGAIWISCVNYKTVISQCTFTGNNVTSYGGAIYSDRGNNVEISYCSFHNNKALKSHGASISCYGNIYLDNNTFYDNSGKDDIYMMLGTLEAHMNIFSGNIKSIFSENADIIDANLNYWGYNDIKTIESKNPGINIENWLIAQRKDYDKKINGNSKHIVMGEISQYLSRLEKDITSIEPVISNLPVIINDTYRLNEEIIANKTAVMKIGEDEFRCLDD